MNTCPTLVEPGELSWSGALSAAIVLESLLRLICAWFGPLMPFSDGKGYIAFARTLVQHGTFFGWTSSGPTSFRPPETSLLRAGVLVLFGVVIASTVQSLVLDLRAWRQGKTSAQPQTPSP